MVFTLLLRFCFSAIAAAFSSFLRPDPALVHSNALTDNLAAPGTVYYASLGVWKRFDTLWYLHIAAHGYDRAMADIFYPLYPAIIRIVSFAMPATAAALSISTVAAFFAFWGLLRLMETEVPSQTDSSGSSSKVAALLALAAWPSSFVLFAGYAESMTLALIVWAVIFARKGSWELAALCGFFAGLSRPSGVLVVVPLTFLAMRSVLRDRRLRSLTVLLAPVGFIGYWAWLHWSGRVSVVDAYRIYQGATFAPPWASLAEASRLIFAHGDSLLAVKLILVLLATGFSLRREVRIEDKLFAIALTLQMFMYTGRPLLGGPRYALPMYPAFIAMGTFAAQRLRPSQFAFYLACFGALNLAWMWAFLNWSLVF